MIQPPDSRLAHLALLLQSCSFDFPKLSPADKRLNWKRLQAALVQWQLTANGSKFTANRLQFMAYNIYGFSAAEFTSKTRCPRPWLLHSTPIPQLLK